MLNDIQTITRRYAQKLPPLDLDLLLAASIKRNKEFVLAHPEYRLSTTEHRHWQDYWQQYKRGYSVAAIVGRKEFFGLDFIVDKHVLIPRPATEILVEQAIAEIKKNESKNKLLIDVGTGTGCIPISIIKTLGDNRIRTIAIDISPAVLHIAKLNARKHGVKVKFLHGNLLAPLANNNIAIQQFSNVFITANLPYLAEKGYRENLSVHREPRIALIAKKNGLDLYEKLFKQIRQITDREIRVNGFFEIGKGQSSAIKKLVKKFLPAARIELVPDLTGRDRLLKISISNPQS